LAVFIETIIGSVNWGPPLSSVTLCMICVSTKVVRRRFECSTSSRLGNRNMYLAMVAVRSFGPWNTGSLGAAGFVCTTGRNGGCDTRGQ
jgi:hypothetical protein